MFMGVMTRDKYIPKLKNDLIIVNKAVATAKAADAKAKKLANKWRDLLIKVQYQGPNRK